MDSTALVADEHFHHLVTAIRRKSVEVKFKLVRWIVLLHFFLAVNDVLCGQPLHFASKAQTGQKV